MAPFAGDDVTHLGPTMTEHINVHGRYHFNLDQPPHSLRPLPPLPRQPLVDGDNPASAD